MTKNSQSGVRVVGVILARGGSKGLPGKNIAPMLGRTLLGWSVLQLQDAGVGEIFVSTDSEDIAFEARRCGAQVIMRPPELATDFANGDDAVLHAIDFLRLADEDWVLMPQVTSPLRLSSMVEEFVRFTLSGNFDSAFSACRVDDVSVWIGGDTPQSVTYEVGARLPRQLRPPMYVENGSLYLTRVMNYKASKNRLDGKVGIFEMPRWTLTEIDEPEDLLICEAVATKFMMKG
jgi:N-acylneuraminate cytidylyltransferase